MRFGLFYEHQLPRPWAEGDEERLLNNALEQVELADKLGFDYVWEVEHHFLEEYSHSSAPEVFLAAASQRTKRIRLGHGICAMPPAYNHPARVAERVSTLDLLSGGRVDLGTGETSSQAELGAYGIARDEKREQWEESVEVCCRLMAETPFTGHKGKWLEVPPRNMIPKPKQQPHPPVWVACSRRDTIEMAARRGIGALSFSFVEPEEAAPWVAAYDHLLATDCDPIAQRVTPGVAVVLPMMVHDDEATAIDRGIDGAHFFGYSLTHYYVFGNHHPGHTDVHAEFQARRQDFGFTRELINPDGDSLAVQIQKGGFGSLRGAIGTPEQVIELLERYEAAGVDQVIFVAQCGNNRHEDVCESYELFAEKVLPRFLDGREEKEALVAARRAPAVERAMARLDDREQVDVSDYEITAAGEPSPAYGVISANGSLI